MKLEVVAIDGVIHIRVDEFKKLIDDVRENVIDEITKTLAKEEDTILSFRQYCVLQELKKKGGE